MKRIFLLLPLLALTACSIFKSGRMIAPDEGVGELLIEMESGLIIVEAEVNGVKGKFLYDNGFSLSALDDDFADQLELDWKGTATATDGANRQVDLRRGVVDEIALGGFRFVNTGVYEIDTDNFFPCYKLDGVIGASVINKANWHISYADSSMHISKKPYEADGFVAGIDITRYNTSYMDMTVNGITVDAKIDLGYSGPLKLRSGKYKGGLKGLEAEKRVGVASLSVSGVGQIDTTYEIAEGITTEVDGKPLPVQPVVVLSLHLQKDARIGNAYFRQYDLYINSSDKEYMLKERDMDPAESRRDRYAISAYPIRDTVRIVQLNPAEASTAGIDLMDELFYIDGKPVASFEDFCALSTYIRDKLKRKEDILIRIRGKEEVFRIPYKEAARVEVN